MKAIAALFAFADAMLVTVGFGNTYDGAGLLSMMLLGGGLLLLSASLIL